MGHETGDRSALTDGARLQIIASGGLEIWDGERRIDGDIPAKAALIITYLADQRAPVSRAVLAGLFWSDDPEERARTSLRVVLTRTRHLVPQLRADRSSVELVGEVDLDLHSIEHGDLDTVMRCHRGEALAGLEVAGAELFSDWLTHRREQHRTLLMRSLAAGLGGAVEEGRWGDAVTVSRRMIAVEQWNESAHRHLMTALAQTEGRSSALVAFDRCAKILLEEFGLQPDAQTQALADTIRRGDAPAPPRSGATVRSSSRSIEWRLLGDVAVVIDDVPHDLGGQHRRSIMAYLALRAPERCSIDDLTAAVWGPDAPVTARQAVGRHVRELQGLAVELADRIEHVPDGIRLTVLPHEVDAHDVRSAIAAAQTELRYGELEAGAAELRTAISRWTGTSLGGVARHGPLGAARVSLDELRLVAIEDLIEAELALGRHREIVSEAEAFALEHPTRDRAWTNLMLARARTGRRAAAVEAFHQFEANLAIEGLTVPSSTVALHRHIVDESPAVLPAQELTPGGGRSWTLPATTFAVPLPPAFERSSFVEFAGRANERAMLQQALDTSMGTRVVFVTGEPGIGKSRLAAELAATAHAAGGVVLYGRCDRSLGVPFQAWREALAHLADHVPPHIARRHLDRFGPMLHLLMPALVDGTRGNDHRPDGAQVGDASQQELLFRATAGLLADVAQRRRLVVVVDDMQWADRSTVDLMRHLARHAGHPMLILGLYRSTEVSEDHPVHPVIAELVQADIASVMELSGLDEAARTDLVRSVVDDAFHGLAARIAERIAGETGGNPFFFTELLRSMSESGSIESVLDADLNTVLPTTVQRVVLERVKRLGEGASSTLRTASVFGREFDLDVLAVVLERGEDDVLSDLEEALSAGLVTDAPLGRDRFSFAHDLVHHTLIGQLSESRRCRLHARVAAALESVHGPQLGDHLPVVASHLVAADDPALRSLTVQRCREAGQVAAGNVAMTEAIEWFTRALDRLEPDDEDVRARLLVDLGTEQRNTADPAHRSTLIEAGRLALERGDVATLVDATLANSRGMNAHVWEIDHDRIEMLRAALGALGAVDSAERAELLASLANEQWDEPHREESEGLYRDALTIARRSGDTATLARVLVRVSRARNFKLDRTEMTSVARELRDVARVLDLTDPLLVANCLTTVLNTSIRLGLADETRDAIVALRAIADELPLPMFTLPAHLAECLEAGLRGDISAYEAASTRTYHHATSIGDEEAGFIFEGQMFYTAYLRGDLAPILEFSINVMNERPEVALYRAVCTLIHVEAGRHGEARTMLDRDVEIGIDPTVDMFQIQALVAWADAAATLGHVPACVQLYDALVGLSTETSGHLVQVGEPIDISLGRLATVLERFDAAAHHFDTAQEIADGFGARWMDAQVGACRAAMQLRRGRPGDVRLALDEAARARSIAAECGYAGVEARATAVIEAAE